MVYSYGFGDPWEHNIEIVGCASTTTDSVVCIDGEGHLAGEDMESTLGWG